MKKISIIIPVYNEESYLPLCLDSLSNLDYPKDGIEVIIIDNGSTDSSLSIAKSYRSKFNKLLVDHFPDGKIGAVRNRGISLSNGDIYAFVDADCVVPPSWLNVAIECFNNSEQLAAVGGDFLYKDNPSWLERAWALNKGQYSRKVHALATGSFIVNRFAIENAGIFNEAIEAGEDTELSARLIRSGYILELNTGCNVIHLGYPNTVGSFIKRQIWQTKDYIITRNGRFDRTFVLTFLFLISNLAALTLMPFYLSCTVLLLFLSLIIPSFSSMYRFSQSAETFNPIILVKIFGVQYLYYVGRSIGLCISFFKLLSGKY